MTPTPDLAPTSEQLLEVFRSSPFTAGTEYSDDLKGWVDASWDGDVLTLSFEPDEDMTVPTGDVSAVYRFHLVPLTDEQAGDES